MGGGGGAPTQAALIGARNVCLDCIKRGPKHVKISKKSKRIIFRYEFEEERFDDRNSWQKSRTEANPEMDRKGNVIGASGSSGSSGAGHSPIAPSQVSDTPDKTSPPPKAVAAVPHVPPKAGCAGPPPPPARKTPPPTPPPAKHKGNGDPGGKRPPAKHKGKGSAPGKRGSKAKTPGAPTAAVVIKRIGDVTRHWGAVMMQSTNIASKIDSDPSWQWANTDRFGGKLKRSIERCNETLKADLSINAAIVEGATVTEEYINQDINGHLSRIQNIQFALDAVDSCAKRIRGLHVDDEPSQ